MVRDRKFPVLMAREWGGAGQGGVGWITLVLLLVEVVRWGWGRWVRVRRVACPGPGCGGVICHICKT